MRDAVTPGVGHLRTRRIVGSIVLMGARPARAVLRAVRRLDSGSRPPPSLIGLGAVLMMFGVRVPGAAARAAAGARARRADGAVPGPDRQARARERDPPAAAHRGDRRGADGRPRARGARGGLRRGPERLDRQDDRRPGPGRADRPEPGRLQPDPGRRSSTRVAGRAGRRATSRRCASRSAGSRATRARPRSTASTRRRSTPCSTLKWDEGDADDAQRPDRPADAVVDSDWAAVARPRRRRQRSTFTTPAGKQVDLQDRGHVQATRRA